MRQAEYGGGGGAPLARPRRRAVPSRLAPARHSQATLRFVAGGALILALASAAFGARGYLELSKARLQAQTLSQTVGALQQRLSVDERHAAGEQRRAHAAAAQAASAGRQSARVVSQLADVSIQMQGLQGELARSAACVPELQSEIKGLVISWHMGPFKASPDTVTLADKAHLSSACATGPVAG